MAVKDDDLRRWIQAGLIDASTGGRIRAFEDARSAEHEARSDRPTVPELLVYIAAAITAVGIAVLTITSWEDLASAARVVIPGVAAAGFLGAGYLLGQTRNGALVRGASLAWLLGGALVCTTVAIAAAEGGWSEQDVSLAAGIAALVSSIALWAGMRMHPQVVGLGAAALLFSMAVSGRASEDWTMAALGVSLASFGLAVLLATEIGVLVPRSSARLVGGAALAFGAFLAGLRPSPALAESLAVGVVIVLVGAGIRVQSLVYVAFGVLAAFAGLLTLILRHVDNPTLAGLALIAIGLLLLLAIAGLRKRLSWAQWGALTRNPAVTSTTTPDDADAVLDLAAR